MVRLLKKIKRSWYCSGILLGALLAGNVFLIQAADEEDVMMEFRLLNEDDQYLRTGDELKLQFAETHYKDVPVQYEVTWSNRPGAIEVDENGVLHAEKAGDYHLEYELAYTKDTLEQLDKEYPDQMWDLPDIGYTMNFVVSDDPFVFRLYNPNSGEHFYTSDKKERQFLIDQGWQGEGYGWLGSDTSRQPVYRLYDPNAGDHHCTMDKKEYDALGKLGWTQEGTAWGCSPETDTPVYRQYNPNAQAGRHNLTSNTKEKEYLISVGWKDEGIVWYTPVIAYSDIDLDWLEETPPMAHN